MRARSILLMLVLMLALLPVSSAEADTAAGRPVFFPETGHTLAYNFRQFWEGKGGLPIFGYPLTEVFLEDGRPVQYFERARFEWHADKLLVQEGLLGRWAARGHEGHPAFAPVAQPASGDLDYYPETGHTLRGGFRGYWRAHGGLPIFGFPISEEFREVNPVDGQEYVVQYFERARFEWHPELTTAYQVELGHLGVQYLRAEQPAPTWALERVAGVDAAWNAVRPTSLRIDRIGINTEVVEGGFSLGAWDVPRYTAVHYWPVSAFPGSVGNIVVAGHVGYRDIIFNRLPEVQLNDEIVLTVGSGERRYQVTDIWTVLPNDSWVMAPTGSEVLTLITCVPIGVYSHRLIVRATPITP